MCGAAEMHALVKKYTFNGLWRLVSKFHFLVALGPEYGGTKVLHKKKFCSSATATSTGSDARVHTLCLWVLTSTKRLVGSVQSMYQMVVEEPNCPFCALANKTLGQVARRKMLMHAR